MLRISILLLFMFHIFTLSSQTFVETGNIYPFLEKLTPEKKTSHKQTMDDFIQVESSVLNKLLDFISSNKLSEITHWNEISIRKPVKGMTEDECRLAFGKPQTVLETNGEVQWMYNSSFYLFFKNGQVQTIIK